MRYIIKLKNMKHFFQTILFAAAMIMVVCSCEELQKDGAWDPVELDKSNIEFSSEGGEETVTALNYSSWWINGGYESVTQVNGKSEYNNYTYATSSGGKTNMCDLLDGGWYHVTVPNNGKSNTIIIKVDPRDDVKPRQAVIAMQAGNAFTYISISQR